MRVTSNKDGEMLSTVRISNAQSMAIGGGQQSETSYVRIRSLLGLS